MEPGESRPLGRSPVRVTRLGLGTAALGGLYRHVEDGVAVDVVRRGLELGSAYLDTAPLYGHGTSERRLAAALDGVPRSSYVLSTKVGRLVLPRADGDRGLFADAPPSDVVFDFSADGVQRSLEASLERLGLDRVDVVYLHDPDDHVEEALGRAYPVLHELRDQGVIRAIGVGTNRADVPARFVRETDVDVVLLAGRWTLLDRSGGADLLPAALDRQVSVVVGGVYNSGVLADPGPAATYDYGPASSPVVARATALARVCAEHGVPLKAAAIQFPFRHPAVTCVLTGPRSVAELEENAQMLRTPLPAGLWDALDAALAVPGDSLSDGRASPAHRPGQA